MTFIEKTLAIMIALIIVFIVIAYLYYNKYSQDNYKTKASLATCVLVLEILEALAITFLIFS